MYYALRDGPGLNEFAVKEMDISPQVTEDGRLDLFKRETDILTQLKHPNIVRMHEKFDLSNYMYLVFDFCSQGDLEKYLRKNNHQRYQILIYIFSRLNET